MCAGAYGLTFREPRWSRTPTKKPFTERALLYFFTPFQATVWQTLSPSCISPLSGIHPPTELSLRAPETTTSNSATAC